MDFRNEWKQLFWGIAVFIVIYFLPLDNLVFQESLQSSLELAKWYAREHVLLCLIPAFFIAGTIAVFVSQNTVIKYLGSAAKKWVSYSIASVSGSILAVCSCTVLPLFTGIYKRGAGLGPATAFLYSGPAVNIMAIILTAKVLGFELGIARVIGAVLFSIIIGLSMHFIFRGEESSSTTTELPVNPSDNERPLWQTITHFVILVLILISATWGPSENPDSISAWIYQYKWIITGLWGLGLAASLVVILNISWIAVLLSAALVSAVSIFSGSSLFGFIIAIFLLSLMLSLKGGEPGEWMNETWGFAKQILPLLVMGVFVAGFLLGAPESGGGIIPEHWISHSVGGNSIGANLVASVIGAFMYFATLTEIPILQGLMSNGMGNGPALALLLAGPALSLPNMLVIRGVLGNKKTAIYILLVIILSTLAGIIYGGINPG
jgi:hypothetical protein